MNEPDPETMPLQELVVLYEQKVEAFKNRNKNINYLVNARNADTIEQKTQGRTARLRMMGEAKRDIAEMGKILQRRLAQEINNIGAQP